MTRSNGPIPACWNSRWTLERRQLFLDRPVCGQILSQLFVFRIIAVARAQAFERRDHLLLIHLHSIGDHARGLFEAQASIAVSAAHALEDVKIFFLHSGFFRDRLMHYPVTPENPVFCVVIISVSVCGFPSAFTVTRIRTNMRHASPAQITEKMTNAFSVTRPAGSLQITQTSN